MNLLKALLLLTGVTQAQTTSGETVKPYPPALVSFDDFKSLVAEVEPHRKQRLVDLDTFQRMSREPDTIILDARSDFRFERKHLAGAKHLSFTDFTAENLRKL
ncbi:MAG: rhodanese-like domain-containing protein, partial [Thaumarchaeota archaeon]|nr:rhodanese-like domain-containing protein [Nitrososphaerota archaeon]